MTTDHSDLSPRAASGIEGLDRILNGGFPRHHTFLVQGRSGTGKTTLGMQFLLEGVRAGETVLYIALLESAQELHEVAQSHGWSLENVYICELAAVDVVNQAAAAQTVFHTADVELSELANRIIEMIEQVQPDRVVFDSVAQIRLLAESIFRYRREIFSLRQLLLDVGATVLFLDNHPPTEGQTTLHSLVHGVIVLEQVALDYGNIRRRLQVSKMRGMTYQEGYHDFQIRTGGLTIYPRLSEKDREAHATWEIVSSSVDELDALLGGGLETGTACLIVGASGTGKTTLATLYMYAAMQRGEKAAAFLFDERLETFHKRSAGVGMDLRTGVEKGMIRLHTVSTGQIAPGEFAHMVQQEVEKRGVKVVLIDSLSGYLSAMPQERLLVTQMHELLAYLSRRGVLTLLVVTQHGIVGEYARDPVELSYLADSVLLLRHFEAGGALRQAIAAIKKRHGVHEKTIREMHITANGIVLSRPLHSFRGILTGNPVFEGKLQALIDLDEVDGPASDP